MTMIFSYSRHILVVCICVLAFQSQVIAQADKTIITTKNYGDWQVRCEQLVEAKKSCVMTLQVLAKNSGQQLLQANIGKTARGVLMTVIFPLGLYLPAGATLQIEDFEKNNFSFDFCTEQGCFINQILEDDLIQLLRKKESANFSIEVADDQAIHIPFSVNGFLDAYRVLSD